MLSVYTNQQDLLKATSESPASRIESIDSDLLKLDYEQYSVTFEDRNTLPDLELHVYTPDGVYLTGNHNVEYFSVENNDTTSNLVALQHLAIDIPKTFNALGLTRGQYRVVYNLFDNILGSYKGLKLWIKEISPSRRELRLQLSDNDNIELTKQLDEFQTRWNLLAEDDRFDSFVLNFGTNETYQIINVRFETEFTETPEVLVKLYNPLPAKYGEKSKLWISEELINPVLDNVILVPKFVPDPVTKLRPANFEIEEFEASSVATDFKTWNDLLSTNLKTSQQIIDSQFSGSLSGIKLNINYRIFDNFVHYGSAVERVKNFKYKLELIEQYSDRINDLVTVSDQKIVQSNLSDLYTKRNRVVSGFDDFEKYLFFESTGSKLYTHYDEITGSRTVEPVEPWPKIVPTSLNWIDAYQLWSTMATQWQVGRPPDPYEYFSMQADITSQTAIDYYANLLEIASIYDKNNVHKLQSTIPYHIQTNEDNEDFLLFVHMLGQHFDILWSYINHLTTIKDREEHPKDGMPDDLLYHVASSLGFELLNGRSSAELWKYNLGTDQYGDVLKNDQGLVTLSEKQITREIWRRIVNNLPYILKTKGTSRSIKAMLNCFGIPLTVLTIKEYGGPSTFTNADHYPEYIHDVFHYAWFSNTETGSLSLNVSQYTNGDYQIVAPNTLQFRFKTDNNYDYYQNNYYNLLSISSGSLGDVYNLILSKESADDEEGTLTLFNRITGTAISASNLEIFDNSWNLVTIESTEATSSFKLTKSLYGKTIYIKSASFYGETIFPNSDSVTVSFASGSRNFTSIATLNGNPLTNLTKFYGHFQEVRLWSGSLTNPILEEHAASPNTYTFNRDLDASTNGEESAKPYEHLLQRFTLSTKNVLSGSFYQPSCHPNQKLNTGSLYFTGFDNSGSITFEGFEETYYTPSPSLGGSSLYSNKIRIESSSLNPNGRLNTKTRIEKSSFDQYSIDSNRVGVYFSPQTAINEDIFNQIGYFEIDDYIGDPRSDYETHYPIYDNFAINYWKKYENRNDFEAYFRALEIYDFTVFKYIKRLLPERVNAIVGLVVENNVLNRSKVKFLRNKPSIQELSKQGYIDTETYIPSAEYKDLKGLIDEEVLRPNAIYQNLKGLIDEEIIVPVAETKNIKGIIDQEIIVTTAETKNIKGIIDGDVNPKPSAETKDIKGIVDGNVDPIPSAETKDIRGIIDGEVAPEVISAVNDIGALIDYIRNEPEGQVLSEAVALIDMPDVSATGEPQETLIAEFEAPIEWKYPSGNVIAQSVGEIQQQAARADGDILSIDRGVIVGSINTDRLGTSWLEKKITGKYIYTQSGSFNPIGKQVYNSRVSTYKKTQILFYSSDVSASLKLPSSSSLVFAEVNNDHGYGYENLKFAGSKLTGPGINIDTPNTVDGGPVVKVTKVNPNQIVFANNQITTIDENRTGNRKKSI
jgi:hypothetical protein